jgi:hypothetical protein
VIDNKKIDGYALNPDHPDGSHKARVFKSALGYDRDNSQGLVDQIRDGVQRQAAVPKEIDEHGTRFGVDIPVTGPTGKSATVRTGSIYDPGSALNECASGDKIMATFDELQRVELTEDVIKGGVTTARGSVGTIIDVYSKPREGYRVEFVDPEDGDTLAELTLYPGQIRVHSDTNSKAPST